MLGQPKLNGSNCLLFINGDTIYSMNRHKDRLSRFEMDPKEILNLYNGKGWMVINGEYMNKAKLNSKNENFNKKLVIFDILVLDSDYLVGSTFKNRIDIIDGLWKSSEYDNYINQISDNVFKVKSFESGFTEIYNGLVETDMYEGLVLKRKSAKLEIGASESNNTKSQVKFRKPTKNYKY